MTSKTKILRLPRPLVNKILAHAQQNPDVEVCGLIGSRINGKIDDDTSSEKDYYMVDNVSKNPQCRFLMDAPQQIKTLKHMREKKQELFAIVHSHPTATATPSQLDIAESSYKDVYYIIVSLNTKGVLEMRAYTQQKDSMQEVELVLEDTDG